METRNYRYNITTTQAHEQNKTGNTKEIHEPKSRDLSSLDVDRLFIS